MIDIPPPADHSERDYPFLDVLLRDAIPEIKLALGELIDRENARALPGRYAKLLPETLLVVTLRPDAAEAITPVARQVERELTDSCRRHGSLYDRDYRVQLRRAEDEEAPLFTVAAHAGQDLAPAEAGEAAPPVEEAAQPAVPAPSDAAAIPAADPDATRLEGAAPAGAEVGWEPGRWLLMVEDLEGAEQEVFRLTEPYTTVGRRSGDPLLRVTIALSNVPHLSRRQLALLWEPRGEEPGFRVYNLGLNPVHLPDSEVAGARVGREALRLEEVGDENAAWLAPGVPLRIGEQGPVLRIEEVPAPAEDPEATVYE